MESPQIEEEISDDEVFFGKITLKEMKKMFCNQQDSYKTHDVNSSPRLIETHSHTNMRSKAEDSPVVSSNPGLPALEGKSDDSFIQMENMVSKLCVSPRISNNIGLNNTLEVNDYILNHGPNKVQDPVINHYTKEENKADPIDSLPLKISPTKDHTIAKDALKITQKTELKGSHSYYTPSKRVTKETFTEFITPSSSIKSKTPIFKTPATLMKPSTPRNTPSRNAYQHISSPIASYIKNCSQVPLVKVVHPKKPLPGASSIPKFVRNPSQGKVHKNNEIVNLPSVAYNSVKKTKVIERPVENKLPQSQWVKKIMSFPRPTVKKHDKKEIKPVKKQLLSNQDSIK